jgi:hypothetical protein
VIGRLIPLHLRSRSAWQPREYPRRREGALKDERKWIDSLDDRELAQLAAELGRIDKVVKTYKRKVDKRDAA